MIIPKPFQPKKYSFESNKKPTKKWRPIDLFGDNFQNHQMVLNLIRLKKE